MTTISRKTTGIAWLVSLTLLLAACGFQLRGVEHSITSRYESIRLTNSSRDEQFHSTLRQSLKNAGVTLSEDADARLEILGTKAEKRTASYSSRAKSAEFELLKTVNFRFSNHGRELIGEMPLQARRSYLYRESAAVGKAEEESLLWQEMDLDLAQRILMALQRTVVDDGKATAAEYPPETDPAQATGSSREAGSEPSAIPAQSANTPAPEAAPQESAP